MMLKPTKIPSFESVKPLASGRFMLYYDHEILKK